MFSRRTSTATATVTERPTDGALVRAAQRGDKAAFVEIVARYQATVCGIALGLLADFAESEDVGQEVFLQAWQKIGDLREAESLRAWLSTMARHAAFKRLRSRKACTAVDGPAGNAEFFDDRPGPDEMAASEDEATLVREHLSRLPENYRLPLVLFYRQGESVRAVAETLGLSEDTVKQRLARGREMLRNRLTGLVEAALRHSAPTAIFTLTVASAIGALTTPAALAGSVFSAASSGTVASASSSVVSTSTAFATSTTSPALAVMSSSHLSFATAALILTICLPLGYTARMVTEKSAAPPSAPSAPAAQAQGKPKPRDPLEAYGSSELLAEWRRLHEAHGSDAAAMPSIYNEIAEEKNPFRRRALRAALIAEWVRLDPQGGFAFFSQQGNNVHLSAYVEEWMDCDAAEAIDFLATSPHEHSSLLLENIKAVARHLPERLGEWVSKLPKPEGSPDRRVTEAFAIHAEANLARARAAAEALTGDYRVQALAGVAQAWARQDADAAVAWARALPEDVDRDAVVRAALVGLASTHPVAALDRMREVPPKSAGSHHHYSSSTGALLLGEAAKADFDATMDWIAKKALPLDADDVSGLSAAITARLNDDPAGFLDREMRRGTIEALIPAIGNAMLNEACGQAAPIWEWLQKQTSLDSKTSKALRSSILYSAAHHNPAEYFRLLDTLPAGEEKEELIAQTSSTFISHGRNLLTIEAYLRQVPESIRGALTTTAISRLGMSDIINPAEWIARLEQVPAQNRDAATRSLARAWAVRSPEESLAWVTSWPEGALREQSVGDAVSTWMQSDSLAATEWASTLPPGRDRDAAAYSIGIHLADEMPYEALEWARSISDPKRRHDGLNHTLIGVMNNPWHNPAELLAWLDKSTLAPMEKAELRGVIAKRLEHQTLNQPTPGAPGNGSR